MAGNEFGRHCRKGFTQAEFLRRFSDEETAMQWYIQERWGDTPTCPHCRPMNVNMKAKHPDMPHRCRARGCRRRFSVKTGTSMECSIPGCRDWLYSSLQVMTHPGDVSSRNLHHDFGATWRTAWFVGQRLRQGMVRQVAGLTGDIEDDGTYMGGRRKNMSLKKRKALAGPGRGAVGKAIVTGAASRRTGKVVVKEIPDTGRETLQGFVDEVAQEEVAVYTDGHRSHVGLDKRGNRRHGTVRHSAGEYVNGCAGMNPHGILLGVVQENGLRHLAPHQQKASEILHPGSGFLAQYAKAGCRGQDFGSVWQHGGAEVAPCRPDRLEQSSIRLNWHGGGKN